MRIGAPVLGLALSGLVAASVASSPVAAQGLNVMAPTHPTIGRLFGLQTGQQFVLKPSRTALELSRSAEPRRLQVCVTTGTTPASNNLAARVITDQGERVIPVGHCQVVEGSSIEITPAVTSAATSGSRACTPSSAEPTRGLPAAVPGVAAGGLCSQRDGFSGRATGAIRE